MNVPRCPRGPIIRTRSDRYLLLELIVPHFGEHFVRNRHRRRRAPPLGSGAVCTSPERGSCGPALRALTAVCAKHTVELLLKPRRSTVLRLYPRPRARPVALARTLRDDSLEPTLNHGVPEGRPLIE